MITLHSFFAFCRLAGMVEKFWSRYQKGLLCLADCSDNGRETLRQIVDFQIADGRASKRLF